MITLKNLNFGEIDAKNELLKDARSKSTKFLDSYMIPSGIDFSHLESGLSYFVVGLKGTGKNSGLAILPRIAERKRKL